MAPSRRRRVSLSSSVSSETQSSAEESSAEDSSGAESSRSGSSSARESESSDEERTEEPDGEKRTSLSGARAVTKAVTMRRAVVVLEDVAAKMDMDGKSSASSDAATPSDAEEQSADRGAHITSEATPMDAGVAPSSTEAVRTVAEPVPADKQPAAPVESLPSVSEPLPSKVPSRVDIHQTREVSDDASADAESDETLTADEQGVCPAEPVAVAAPAPLDGGGDRAMAEVTARLPAVKTRAEEPLHPTLPRPALHAG